MYGKLCSLICSPRYSIKFENWKSIRNYMITMISVLFMGSIIQFNAFMLKAYLWIPKKHWLNVGRLLFHAFSGSVSWNTLCRRVIKQERDIQTTQFFLQFVIILLECLII